MMGRRFEIPPIPPVKGLGSRGGGATPNGREGGRGKGGGGGGGGAFGFLPSLLTTAAKRAVRVAIFSLCLSVFIWQASMIIAEYEEKDVATKVGTQLRIYRIQLTFLNDR